MKKISLFIISVLINYSIYSQNNDFMKEIPEYKNSVVISYTINVPLNVDEVYRFITEDFSDAYTLTSNAHHYFTIQGGGKMKVGSIINCSEKVENQSILHEYIVGEMIENERIFYYSKPSYSKTQLKKKVIEGQSNTYVYWDLNKKNDKETYVTISIVIQFKNGFEKFLINSLVNGLRPWREHCVEEMQGFKNVITEKINN